MFSAERRGVLWRRGRGRVDCEGEGRGKGELGSGIRRLVLVLGGVRGDEQG